MFCYFNAFHVGNPLLLFTAGVVVDSRSSTSTVCVRAEFKDHALTFILKRRGTAAPDVTAESTLLCVTKI